MPHLHALIIVISISGAGSSEAGLAAVSARPPVHAWDHALPLVLTRDTENRVPRPQGKTGNVNTRLPLTSPEYRKGESCVTVCSRWGEECVTTRTSSDRATRKCVRACQSFSVECL